MSTARRIHPLRSRSGDYPRAYNVTTMKARLVKIGNSRGVRIPKSMLEEAEIDGDIEMRVVDGEIHISAAEPPTGLEFLVLSRDALSDWDRPEEDEAWAHLQ
ncbi:MAG TPA: AbrB/MazE/SpoVT family DNA-binding domain-containing protein [Pseudolysinimonas sp.]|nr:AbrB/MazE/SpoVT family DNA-binding domain-containing protein [Pseudolysinimonas sp.]